MGLDARMRARFQRLLAGLMRGRLRVLLITPRVEDLPPEVTHLLWVDRCRVVTAGRREDILARRQSKPLLASRLPARGSRVAARPGPGQGGVATAWGTSRGSAGPFPMRCEQLFCDHSEP